MCETYRNKIFRYARQLCRNREDAEDLTQETLVRAFRGYDRFENQRPIENWLIKIASNAYLDSLRRARHRPQTVSESDFPCADETGIGGSSESPLDAYVDAEDRRDRIRDAMKLADGEARELLRRVYLSEEPHAKVAQELHITRCTLRTRLYRAKDRIRRRLEPHPAAKAA